MTELSDRCQVSLLHCGTSMVCKQTRITWEGKPGGGYELTEAHHTCACGATVVITVREPS